MTEANKAVERVAHAIANAIEEIPGAKWMLRSHRLHIAKRVVEALARQTPPRTGANGQATEVERLTADKDMLQFLLARYGDRVRMADAIVLSWQQAIDEALEGRCAKCGGLHRGDDCNGPPLPTVPHPFAGRMMG